VSELCASVLKAFGDQLVAERARSEERLERAAADGVDRAAYAREQRIVQAVCDLGAVSPDRWLELGDWLDRFAVGPDAPPVRLRPRDRKGSWAGAEGEAVRKAISELEAAASRVDAALGIDGLDAKQQSGRDMEGRMGRAFHEARYALDGVREGLDFAICRIRDPSSELDDPDTDDPQPFDIAERRPATRAFPELMRFWTEEAKRGEGEKGLFMAFASAALRSAAAKAGDSPAEWTAGLDEAFKRR
jgi:hypothetical protein